MVDNVTTPPATDYSGVREYIGARYVPVFANPAEWDNTRGYEPLTIVLHQGNSFTSTQYVPTGVDIDNTEYWLETGNWNAQIEAYRNEVLTLSGTVDSVTEDMGALDTKVTKELNDLDSKLNETISNQATVNTQLEQKNTEQDTRIESVNTNLSNKITQITTKNFVVFGDSWTVSNNNWLNVYKVRGGFSSFKTYGVSGAAILNRPTNTIDSQITAANADSSIDKTLVDEVIVICGVNDYRDNANNAINVGVKLKEILANIQNNYPNAVIKYLLNTQIYGYNIEWLASFYSNGFNGGFATGSLVNEFLWNTYAFQSDNLHPSFTGHNYIASKLLTMSDVPIQLSINPFDRQNFNTTSCTLSGVYCVRETGLARVRVEGNLATAGGKFSLKTPYGPFFNRSNTWLHNFGFGQWGISSTGEILSSGTGTTGNFYLELFTKIG